MKFLKIGMQYLNLGLVTAIRDDGQSIVVRFDAGNHVMFPDEDAPLLRTWLEAHAEDAMSSPGTSSPQAPSRQTGIADDDVAGGPPRPTFELR